MEIVDLAHTDKFQSHWQEVLEFILTSNDKLKNNYVGLDPKNFLSFTALLDNNKIICFSALQSAVDRWGHDIARCSTRMWVHPDFRFTGMTKFTQGDRFLNSYYLIPKQLEIAKNLKYGCVFMSRESNPRAFVEWSELVNRNTGSRFLNLKNRYNVCGSLNPIPESCKQLISLNYTELGVLDLWNHHMEKFKIREDSTLVSTVY